MIGAQLGPYAIQSNLGSGGMGTVYLAETVEAVAGLEPGTKVALKVVHAHLLETPGFFKRFLQEAEIGKRVRHQNVVRTLDADSIVYGGERHHFLVMEFVQGRSLRELLNDLGTVPETLLREIALQTAAGLAAIHEAGVIHRDIKPENVLITDAHEIRIMDLGVAKLQEATLAITKEGQFAGSLRYAAPEQFRRENVGPPADLYSLGVMLYELATGEVPFGGDDAASLIQAHFTETPSPANERNEELSLFFVEVVATLLAKVAPARFASAVALRAVLQQAERSDWWVDRAPMLEKRAARLPRIRVRRETKLHGRADALRTLHDAWNRCRECEGNTIFLEGEAGIGKTRLIDEFLRGLGGEDFHSLYGSYPPSGGMGGLSDAMLGKFGEARLADALAPYLTVTPSLVPTFAAQLKHESPPTGTEPLQGDALQAVIVHLMRALAAEKPTVWILDDIHFAPQESRDFLLAMARAVEDHRVLVVATARPGLELADLSRLGNFQRLPIGRLSPREVVHLLEDAFRSEVLAEKLGGKIAVKSDGVPFFVLEMIRGLKEGQFIREQPDGSYVQTQVVDEIEVPSAVKDLIEGRMRGLTREQRAILDVGAVQGMSFEPRVVARVLEEKRVRVLQDIAEIERRFGLVRGEATCCVFDQNQIQEVLYSDLLPELRAEYHTLLAAAYAESCGEEPRRDDAVFLAHHHLHGRLPAGALPYLEPAFDHLEEGYRNEALLALAERALATPGLLAGAPRAEVLLRAAGRLDLLGRRDEQRAALDEALELADEAGDPALRARARHAMGVCLVAVSEHDAAQAMATEALEMAHTAGDRRLEVRATGLLGALFVAQRRAKDAHEQFSRSLALAREIGDRLGEASATGNLGIVLRALGRMGEALAHGERALDIFLELGDRRGEGRVTGNLGIVLLQLERGAEAQEYLERCCVLSREIGDRLSEANAIGNMAGVSISLGRAAEALDHDERHRALAREIGDRPGEGRASVNLAAVNLALGNPAVARSYADGALALAREIGNPFNEAYALHTLASIAESEGDKPEAVRLFEDALALRREVGEQNTVAETLVSLGRLEAERGDLESATRHLDEALGLGRDSGSSDRILSAAVERARLPDGDVDEALAAIAEHGERAGYLEVMEARFRLWELTKDEAHLAEAHRMLSFLRDHAPTAARETMIQTVPMRRDIMESWERQRDG